MALFPTPSWPAEAAAPEAARRAATWVRVLARLGYAAKGVVYLVIGGIAVQAALGNGGGPEDSGGALRAILDRPFGRAMLAAVAVGIAGHVLWRLVQALLDPEKEAKGLKGALRRGGYLISAALYTGVALEAVRLLTGAGGVGNGSGDQEARHWTALAMGQPVGRWLVAAAGAGVIAFAVYEIYRGLRSDLGKRMNLSRLGSAGARTVVRFGRLGLVARGLVFVTMGWFLVQAALQYDPSEATGLAGALDSLRDRPYGRALLGAVATGLMAYGLWQLVNARFRRIRAG